MNNFIIPIGTKVHHRFRKGVYAIIKGNFVNNNNRYYYVDVYSKETDKLQYPDGNWSESNLIPLDFKNNKEAKMLLEKER